MIGGSNNILKNLQSQPIFDKENNARTANTSLQADRKNFLSRKTKKVQEATNKPAGSLLDNVEGIRIPLSSHNQAAKPASSLVHRNHDELDLSRKVNANRIKKTLNFDNANETDTMCDEANYSSSNSNNYSKHAEDKMSLEKDKNTSMQVEKEQKKGLLGLSHSKIMEEEPSRKNAQSKIIDKYAPYILQTFKDKDKSSTPVNALKKHKIPSNLRAKMIDWMVEVLTSYKCSEQTFFIALNVMDLFFQKTTTVHDVCDLHLVGVTSMFMASKYEEIYPLRLSVVYEKIAHKKLSIDAIKRKEKEILDALEYKITGVTPYDFIMTVLSQINLQETLTEKLYDYLIKVCTYLSKMTMHDYDLINQQRHSELAASTVFVAFKIIEQLDKTFPLGDKVKQLRDLLEVDEEIMFDCATRILSMAKNFEKLYPNLENLKKFNSFSLEGTTITAKSK